MTSSTRFGKRVRCHIRHGQQPREELRERPCGRVWDAPAQDLAVRLRVGDLPECIECCIEVCGGLPRERGRCLDRRRVAIHDCGNEQRVARLNRP